MRTASPKRPDSASADGLEEGLIRDVRLLVDPQILGALHCELLRRLGSEGTAEALLQAGFFHGMRDALRLVGSERTPPHGEPRGAVTPLLTMRFAPGGSARGLEGSWPQHVEAQAVMAAQGSAREPCCFLSAGYASGWLSGTWDADVVALERRCVACGDPSCDFVAREAMLWREGGERLAVASLDALPFPALRELVARELEDDSEPAPGAFDPSSPAVHVWGPVMVVPYAGEHTAAAVESVVREPSATDVSVVVIDLEGAIVDDGFGAVALERTVEAIHAWGAEPVISGLSPLSERVVAEIGRGELIVSKDLCTAIATAFQIAESQRHLM